MAFANIIGNRYVDDSGQVRKSFPFEEPVPSRFLDQVAILERQVKDVPTGWHGIFYDAIKALRAVNCAGRDGIEFSEPVFGRGTLTVATFKATHDTAVSGILSKLSKRSECTCEHCGRTYSVCYRKQLQITLCARCYVRSSLEHSLHRLLRRNPYISAPLIEIEALPPNVVLLIPKGKIRSLQLESVDKSIDYVRHDDLEGLRPAFEAMSRYLDDTTPK